MRTAVESGAGYSKVNVQSVAQKQAVLKAKNAFVSINSKLQHPPGQLPGI